MKKIITDKFPKLFLTVAAVEFFASLLIALIKFAKWARPIVIHFDVYKGTDWVGNRVDIFSFLIFILIISIINLLLSEFIYSRERFLSYLLLFTVAFLNLLTLISIIIITIAN